MNQFNRKNELIKNYSLVLIDSICLLVSYALAYFVRYRHKQYMGQVDFVICLLLVIFCMMYSFILDWNRFIFRRGYFGELIAIVKYTVSLTIILGFSVFVMRQGEVFSRMVFGLFAIFDVVFTYISHVSLKKYLYKFYRKSRNSDKVLLVTKSILLPEIVQDIKESMEWSYEVIAIALADDEFTEKEYMGIPVVARGEDFLKEINQQMMDVSFVHLPDAGSKQIQNIVEYFENMGVSVFYGVGNQKHKKGTQSVEVFAGHLVIAYEKNAIDYRRQLLKRLFDIFGGLIGTVIFAVMYPFVAFAIKINSKGPAIYKQTRVGKNGRRFNIYKFRSMYIDADERKKELESQNEVSGLMFKMENDPRITAVGRFIRKTSIDEFPQFINILKGDMSLVGTRPPTLDEFEKYDAHYRRRLSITPGLTGMWQVSGRSDIKDFDEVVKLDLEYIDNWSLGLDVKILFQTVGVVLFGKGSK